MGADILGLIGSVTLILGGFSHLHTCPRTGRRGLILWIAGSLVMGGGWSAQLLTAIR